MTVIKPVIQRFALFIKNFSTIISETQGLRGQFLTMTKRGLNYEFIRQQLEQADIKLLYDFQWEACFSGKQRHDKVLYTPTASGKTLIAQIVSTRILGKGMRCVILEPTKRLIDQMYDRFKEWYHDICTILRVSGDNRPSPEELETADILIITYESFNGLLAKHFEYPFLDRIGLIVVDELHNLGNKGRGTCLETAIVNAKAWLRPRPHIIYLSATLGNAEELASWLDAQLIHTKERRSKLIVSSFGVSGSTIEQIERKKRFLFARLIKKTFELHSYGDDQRTKIVHIFCYTRNQVEQRAEELQTFLKSFGLNLTVGYSHAGLSKEKQQKAMRKLKKGEFQVFLSTTQYGEGVDFPIKRVIIADAGMFSSQLLIQLSGRAARPRHHRVGYADLIFVGDDQEILKQKDIQIVEGQLIVKEHRIVSQARSSLADIVLTLIARGSVSTKQLLLKLERHYFWHQHKALLQNWSELMNTALLTHEEELCWLNNELHLLSLLRETHEGSLPFDLKRVTRKFFMWVKKNTTTRGIKNGELRLLLTPFTHDQLKDFTQQLREKLLARPKQDEPKKKREGILHTLIKEGFIKRNGGKFSATAKGRWASQFLLPTKTAIRIKNFFATHHCSSEREFSRHVITLIGRSMHEVSSTTRYTTQQYTSFVWLLSQGSSVTEAATRVNIRPGDAEAHRKTASWIAEASYDYLGRSDPRAARVAKELTSKLNPEYKEPEVERGNKGRRRRWYPKHRPKPYPGLQEAIYTFIKQYKLISYKQITTKVRKQYKRPVHYTTVVKHVKRLGIQGKIQFISQGQLRGRPKIYVADVNVSLPEHLRLTCGSCGFFRINSMKDRRRSKRAHICVLNRKYNTKVGRRARKSYVAPKMGACEYHTKARKLKKRTIRVLQETLDDTPCYFCNSDGTVELPSRYNEYTVCPECNSRYYLTMKGDLVVKPGRRGLMLKGLELLLGKAGNYVPRVKKTRVYIRRPKRIIRVKCGEQLDIKKKRFTHSLKDGKTTQRYLIGAIRHIIIEGGEVTQQVRKNYGKKLIDINSPEGRFFVEHTLTPEKQQLADELKHAAQQLRETERGKLLARLLVMSKNMGLANAILHFEKEGLLSPAEAQEFLSQLLDRVAYTFLYWRGNIDNLRGLEGVVESIAWEVPKHLLQGSYFEIISRTLDRYIATVVLLGEAKARTPFSAALNAVYRHLNFYCRKALAEAGFSWVPNELILHYKKKQRSFLGTVVDFREVFLPLFRFAFIFACIHDKFAKTDFIRRKTLERERFYHLNWNGHYKVERLVNNILAQKVYYLEEYMTVKEAIRRCALQLKGFLLEKKRFVPFIYAPDKETLHLMYERFQHLEGIYKPPKKGPPVAVKDLLP